MSALDAIEAKLRATFGAGIDGPVNPTQWQPSAPLLTGDGLLDQVKAIMATQDRNVRLLAIRDREIVRMRDELALERGRTVTQTPEQGAARAAFYPIDAVPHMDGAGRWIGMTLKSALQTIKVDVLRDGANVPILLRINPVDGNG